MGEPALTREFEFRPQDFVFIADLVHAKTGIVLAEHKQDMVYGRIVRRIRSLGLSSFADYCDVLAGEKGGEEMGNFVNAITTNLTSFFREQHHFVHLRDQVLKPLRQLLSAKPLAQRRIRLWSAACSSGAEPYSMAMTCLGVFPDIEKWDIKILATDIDTNMIATGQRGEYSEQDAENIPPNLREKYTLPSKDGVLMHDKLKKLITFKQLNLIEPWPFKGLFEAVFCRNVVIYFNKETQRVLFSKMANVIPAQKWLYIGHSETLHGISDAFRLTGKTIYQRAS